MTKLLGSLGSLALTCFDPWEGDDWVEQADRSGLAAPFGTLCAVDEMDWVLLRDRLDLIMHRAALSGESPLGIAF